VPLMEIQENVKCQTVDTEIDKIHENVLVIKICNEGSKFVLFHFRHHIIENLG
jgi:hypothetical protein